MKYEQIYDGQWHMAVKKGYREQCCGCGLVHQHDFKIDDKGNLWIRSKELSRATASARRKFKFSPED